MRQIRKINKIWSYLVLATSVSELSKHGDNMSFGTANLNPLLLFHRNLFWLFTNCNKDNSLHVIRRWKKKNRGNQVYTHLPRRWRATIVSFGLARTLMAQDRAFWLSSRSNEIATRILLLPSSEEVIICICYFVSL